MHNFNSEVALSHACILSALTRILHRHITDPDPHPPSCLFARVMQWFSESGKLVLKLFGRIRELLDEPHSYVKLRGVPSRLHAHTHMNNAQVRVRAD